jgi:hypothetical protein
VVGIWASVFVPSQMEPLPAGATFRTKIKL